MKKSTRRRVSSVLYFASPILAVGLAFAGVALRVSRVFGQDNQPPAPVEQPAVDPAPVVAPAPAAPEPEAAPPAAEPAAPLPEAAQAAQPAAEAPLVTISPDQTPIAGAEVDRSATTPNLISISLDNVPMEDVVRLFTRISGANIIATSSNLTGTVTVSLKDVEWQPALKSILGMNNLTLMETTPGSGIFSIVNRPEGAPEPLVTQTVFLKYARVVDTQPVVQQLLAPGGTVSPYPSANALVVHSTAGSIEEIKKVVETIDVPRDQVFIEAKFLELNDDAIQDLGINWQVLENFGISAAGMTETFTETRRRSDLDSHAGVGLQQREWTRDKTLINDMPVAGTDLGTEGYKQNVAEAKIVGKNLTEVDASGETLELTTIVPYESTRVRTAILSVDDVKLILSALKQTEGVSIVSNPKIIVANEETATIHIGETERPFISTVTPGQQGIAPIVAYNPGESVDFGVKVNVTPTVNTEDRITVKIEPELVRFVRDSVAPNGQTYPVIGKKTIRTVFTLESGRTAAIGGLTETSDNDAVTKIPLLGDIPILGKYLFSHSHKEKSQKETIIFVTVGIANPETVDQEKGLPDNANLIHRHLIQADRQKTEQQEELRALQAARETEARQKQEQSVR